MRPPTALRAALAAAWSVAASSLAAQIPILTEDFEGSPGWFSYAGDAGVTSSLQYTNTGPAGSRALQFSIQANAGAPYWYGGTGVSTPGAFPATGAERSSVRVEFDLWTNKPVAGGVLVVIKNPNAPSGNELALAVPAPGPSWTTVSATVDQFADTGFDFGGSGWELLIALGNTAGWGASGLAEMRVDNVRITRPGAAPPTFSPAGGVYRAPVAVTLTSPTPGATLRYTTDGSQPTASHGTVYTGPFVVDGLTTVRAVAIAGSSISASSSRRYIVVPSAQSPQRASDRGRVRVASVPDPLGSTPTNPATVGLSDAPLKVLRTDQNTPLRGPSPWVYRAMNVDAANTASLEAAIPAAFPAAIRARGANSLRLVIFDAYNQGTNAPPYPDLQDPAQMENLLVQIERWVDLASEQGLYVCINFHTPFFNTAGPIDESYAAAFWEVVAPYFRNRTHVFYEPTNEAGASIATFASWVNGGAEMAKQVRLYRLVRQRAPETMIVMLTPAQVDEFFTFNQIVGQFEQGVLNLTGTPVDWTRTAVGYHVYFTPTGTTDEMRGIHKAYPALFTEAGFAQDMGLGGLEWSPGLDGFRLAAQAAERLGIGFWQWTTDSYGRFEANWPLLTNDALAKGWMWSPDAVRPPQVETPQFSVPGGFVYGPLSVTITTATPGASIRYTMDGSFPGETTGLLYTGTPVVLTSTTTLQAIATFPGKQPSGLTAATYTVVPAGSVVRVNAAGPAIGGFASDAGFTGGFTSTWSAAIERSDARAAPAAVYQTERWSPTGLTYTSPVLPAGRYEVRLHFAENYLSAAGARRFAVAVNGARSGALWVADLDIFAAAGNRARTAVIRSFADVTPDAGGRITIEFLPGAAENPMVNGVEILPLQVARPVATPAAQNAYDPLSVLLATPTAGATIRYTIDGGIPNASSGLAYTGPIRVNRTGVIRAVATKPGWIDSEPLIAAYAFPEAGSVFRVNAAGPAAGAFAADAGFNATNIATTTSAVSTSGVADAAPQSVYQSERWSPSTITYLSPPLLAGRSYRVRLHFAENWATSAGQRRFHVSVQGTRWLSDFDVLASAGLQQRRAVVRTLDNVLPDADGRIIVELSPGPANNPFINGIEILGAETPWELWRAANFTGAELQDAAVSGPGASPLGDGIGNLQKFAFNLGARDIARTLAPGAGAAGLPYVALADTPEGRRLVVEFIRRTDAAQAGLEYEVGFSDDPSGTDPVPGEVVSVTPVGPLWERVIVRDTVPVPAQSTRFGRVRIRGTFLP